MTACSSRRLAAPKLTMTLQPTSAQVLLGSGVTSLLALFFFTLVWLHLERLFKAFPLLTLPFMATMILGPTFLFVSIRRMTEVGSSKSLLGAALLSATAIGLIAWTFILSLQHLNGG